MATKKKGGRRLIPTTPICPAGPVLRLLRAVAVAILFAAVSNQEKLVTPRLATLDTKIHIGDRTLQTATFISRVLLQVNDFQKVLFKRFIKEFERKIIHDSTAV